MWPKPYVRRLPSCGGECCEQLYATGIRRSSYHVDDSKHRIPRGIASCLLLSTIPHLYNCNECWGYSELLVPIISINHLHQVNSPTEASNAPSNNLAAISPPKPFAAVIPHNTAPQQNTIVAQNFPTGSFTRAYATSG